MLSIVIPAFNEEKYLPVLLDSIKRQDFTDLEIIVADNNSKDNTRNIAKKYRCRIAKGGRPGLARNSGANAAKYDLLFLDSDVVLPDGFLKKFIDRIEVQKLDFATCRVEPITDDMNHRFSYMLKNYGNIVFPYHVSGQCLFVKRALFMDVKGFDESVLFGEEHELAKRLYRTGKGRFFNDLFVLNHPRRQKKEGTYRTLAKDIYSELDRMLSGKADKEIYKKKYGHY